MRGGIRSAAFILAFLFAGGPALAAPEAPASRAIQWQSGDDVFTAAEELTIDRKVAGSLTAAGQIVILTRDAEVAGDAWIAARRAAVEGELDGDLSIRAQEALVNGHVKGNVTFYGLELALGPDARIDGDVDYYAPSTARIDEGARVAGAVNGNAFETGRGYERRAEMRDRWREDHMRAQEESRGLAAPGYHMTAGGAVIFGVLAILFALAAPVTARRMRDGLVGEPALAGGLGLLWLVGVPVLIVLVAISIVGLPLAFLLLLLWPLGMIFGLVAMLVAVGELIASRLREVGKGTLGRIVGIIIATALVWIGISIPFLGALIWLAAVALGIGLLYIGFRTIERTPL
ncbi:hypothetical protein Plav_2773 [Parvibaculum lavamentivorans DS-1]|uniref:DUF8173 domain-containing protein n=1 Tax=Parvibaculum lavamentivorans (strain DS-1 / DSM 13023 / NCIMB 13966) TaxID=402881 RepID=A7HWU8_PARL1|nr:polymer-forming cytoskeletal protein [Parvibaculum lavamentivorans]ABS64381.1 hypothetical protein Plav_2773 [Parvibaculum lavamentivorans DS-1]